MQRISLVKRSHDCISEVLKPGHIAIDATMGNGYDTLFLANIVGKYGKVYAFDVQPKAILNTQRLLRDHGMENRVELVLGGHENLLDLVPEPARNHTKAIMFNLGYLPNSDKKIPTATTTTLVALQAAIALLVVSGRITIVAYTGHPGGREEAESVTLWAETLGNDYFRVHQEIFHPNNPNAPDFITIEKLSLNS